MGRDAIILYVRPEGPAEDWVGMAFRVSMKSAYVGVSLRE